MQGRTPLLFAGCQDDLSLCSVRRKGGLDVNLSASGLRRGYGAAQPLALGVFVYGGLLARNAALSRLEALLMSATVHSGSAQTATVSGIATGARIGARVATILLLNARYVLLRSRRVVLPLGVALVVALAVDRLAPGGWTIAAAGLSGALAAFLRTKEAP